MQFADKFIQVSCLNSVPLAKIKLILFYENLSNHIATWHL